MKKGYLQRMMYKARGTVGAFLAVGLLVPSISFGAATVVGSKHDLSNAGQVQICVFCHTPHNANPAAAPLWNQSINPGAITFTFYTSGTRTIRPAGASPGAVTLACLGCHNAHTNGATHIALLNGDDIGNSCGNCHAGVPAKATMKLGPNLSNDHPVSVPYPIAGTSKLNATSDGDKGWVASKVRLFGGMLECASCHNPHDPTNGKFLAMDNAGSALCLKCHNK